MIICIDTATSMDIRLIIILVLANSNKSHLSENTHGIPAVIDEQKLMEPPAPSLGSHVINRNTRSDSDPRGPDGAGTPCIYEGRVETERNWFGYLANVTVRTTGQLSFEFAYPAHRCCQNVLFYLEDQMAVMNSRMNCWQKEYLLRPEDDQILRLTPSFSWSGCHVTTHEGVETFACKGGRSFSVDAATGDRLTTWYIAVSNCASQVGIDLFYRLEIYGHVGDCVRLSSHESASRHLIDRGRPKSDHSGRNPSAPKASLMPREAGSTRQIVTNTEPCVLQGNITSTYPWFGFIRNISVAAGGGFRYRFTYRQDLQVQNILLYLEEDIVKLDWELSCYQKEEIIGQLQINEQIIEMHFRAAWNGCSASVDKGDNRTQYLTCQGERRYDSARKIFMALSSCRSIQGVQLQYRLEVFGYAHDHVCSGQSRAFGRANWLTALLFAVFSVVLCVQGHLSCDVRLTPLLGVLWCRLIFSNWLLIYFIFNLLEDAFAFSVTWLFSWRMLGWVRSFPAILAQVLSSRRIFYLKHDVFRRHPTETFLLGIIKKASWRNIGCIARRYRLQSDICSLLNVETIINTNNNNNSLPTNKTVKRLGLHCPSDVLACPEATGSAIPSATSNCIFVRLFWRDVQSVTLIAVPPYRHDWTNTGQGQFVIALKTFFIFYLLLYRTDDGQLCKYLNLLEKNRRPNSYSTSRPFNK